MIYTRHRFVYNTQIGTLKSSSICVLFLVLTVFRLTYYILFSVTIVSTLSILMLYRLNNIYNITDSTLARYLIASLTEVFNFLLHSANVRSCFSKSLQIENQIFQKPIFKDLFDFKKYNEMSQNFVIQRNLCYNRYTIRHRIINDVIS